MIVKTGRKEILSSRLNFNDTSKFKFFLEPRSNNIEITDPNMKYESGKIKNGSSYESNILKEFSIDTSQSDVTNCTYDCTLVKDETNLNVVVTLLITVGPSNSETSPFGIFSGAGLIYDGTLISRVTFKETTLSYGSTYKMTYTIYF